MLLFLSSHTGYAAELEFALWQDIENTDNINLAPTNETRETIYVTGLGITLDQDSPKLDTQIEFTTEYRDYRDDTFDDENVPSLLATVNWTVAPERFTWFLQDVLTQEEINDLATPTPNNEQDVNSFTTGPDFFFRITQSDAIQFGLRYTDSYFEETNEDSVRHSQSIGWQHELSSQTGVSLNFENEAVEFDNDVFVDFDRQDLFIRLDSQQARNQLQFDIGATSIKRDRGEDEDEPLAKLSWNRQLSDRSNLGVSLTREISDAGRDVAISTLAGLTSLADSRTSDVFIDERLNVSYTRQGRQTTVTIGIFGRNQDFDVASLDEENRGVNVKITRNVARRLTVTFSGSATRDEFLGLRRVDRDTNYVAGLSYRLGRTLSLGVTAERNRRDSDDSSQDYKENRATLQIAYNRAI